eukprot:9497408-Pyramimonas_sp.AAC.3
MSKICQVREAYRKRGWAFMNSENIAQCKNDDYLGKIKEQEGEACNIYGYLEVNKGLLRVCVPIRCRIMLPNGGLSTLRTSLAGVGIYIQ